jgi:hypothetical protein
MLLKSMFMKKNILCVMVLFYSVFCFSQNAGDTLMKKKNNSGMLGYLGFDGAYRNMPNLNQTLANDSLPGISKFYVGFNFGADVRLKNVLLSLYAEGDMSEKKSGNYNVTSLSLTDELNFGYYLFNGKAIHIAPFAGIGLNSTQLNITQKSGYSSFNDVLLDRNSISLNQNSAIADFGIRVDFADFTKLTDDLIGIKVAYNLGLSNQGWGIDETTNSTIADSPKDRINQFYISLYVGKWRQKCKHS